MRSGRGHFALIALVCALAAPGAAFAADPTGIWFNDTGRGAVEIKPCGEALCGKVVWVKDKSDSDGCGREILGNVPAAGDNVWDGGWIYSPERQKRYDVELRPLDSERLQVTGYAGTKLFSKTMIWTRAPDNIIRCGTSPTAAAAPSPAPAPAPASETATVAKPDTKAAAAEPTPTPAPAPKVAANEERKSEVRKIAGEYLKKDGRGNCNLDTPWVKLNFKCEK